MLMTMVLKSIKKYATITKNKILGVKTVTKETKKAKEENKPENKPENLKAETVAPATKEVETESPKAETGKVGLLLKEMRNKQGKTFAEISQDLCIRKSYLEAIENSDYNNIPEYPYGIGFIRSYADYLGLDGNNIVKMYKDEAEEDFRKKHPYFVMEPQVEATVPNRKYLILSLVALIAVYGGWHAYNEYLNQPQQDVSAEEVVVAETVTENNMNFPLKVEDYSTNVETQAETISEPQNTIVENQEPQIIDVSSTANNAQVTMTDKSFVEPEAENMPVVADNQPENAVASQTETKEPVVEAPKPQKSGLTLNVLKETWIEVKNEKTLYISKVLQAGDSYTLPKADDLKLSVGKADGVEVMFNGKKIYEIAPNKKMNIPVAEIMAGAQD